LGREDVDGIEYHASSSKKNNVTFMLFRAEFRNARPFLARFENMPNSPLAEFRPLFVPPFPSRSRKNPYNKRWMDGGMHVSRTFSEARGMKHESTLAVCLLEHEVTVHSPEEEQRTSLEGIRRKKVARGKTKAIRYLH
jgi:hypothetical protein